MKLDMILLMNHLGITIHVSLIPLIGWVLVKAFHTNHLLPKIWSIVSTELRCLVNSRVHNEPKPWICYIYPKHFLGSVLLRTFSYEAVVFVSDPAISSLLEEKKDECLELCCDPNRSAIERIQCKSKHSQHSLYEIYSNQWGKSYWFLQKVPQRTVNHLEFWQKVESSPQGFPRCTFSLASTWKTGNSRAQKVESHSLPYVPESVELHTCWS